MSQSHRWPEALTELGWKNQRHSGLSYGVQLCLRVPVELHEGEEPYKPKCVWEGPSGEAAKR